MLFLVLNTGAIAQWIVQNSGTTNNIRAVHFIDTFNGFAVGDSGTILKTTDGGENWISLASGTNDQLNTVFCVNENCCFAAGSRSTPLWDTISTILKSTDGGYTWYNSSIGANATDHQSIYFINQDVGYSVGSWSVWGGGFSTEYKTANGGLTWTGVPSVSGDWGSKVTFLDADTGYILTGTDLGFDSYRSDIFKTNDGGATWILNTQFPFIITDVCFVNSLIGYAISGGGDVFKLIEDGGAIQLTSGLYLGTSIFFSDALTGYIAGGYAIQKTTDGGLTWTATTPEITASYVYFPVPDTGYAAGDGGIIYKTTNGGGVLAGINEAQVTSGSLKIFPNPSSENITIVTSTGGHLSILNMSGHEIISRDLLGPQNQMDISVLPAGIYFARIIIEKEIVVRKIIKW